ncbi:lipase [Knoellia sinensis KCTC 19936]|uniref:Lipase n=1 Tax=Knoellia sinensis KCTC 19936 TaxID=1385520 RepID=A0A0A0JEW5_9MICO|nr:lipase [Knoellia sinensis KCTC 19936]
MATLAVAALAATSIAVAPSAQAADPAPPTGNVFASDLEWVSATNGWGPVEKDKSNGEDRAGDGRNQYIEQWYTKGLGVHSDSVIRYHLGGNCEKFVSDVGLDYEVGNKGSVTFTVVADGLSVAQTPVLTGASKTSRILADIDGATYVDLVVGSAGDDIHQDHANWAGARFECSGDGVRAPQVVPTAPEAATFASDLEWESASNAKGPVERDRSNGQEAAGDGGALRIGGTTYTKGLGTFGKSRIRYYTGGKCNTFTAKVGIDDVTYYGTASFHLYADGLQVASTTRLTGGHAPQAFSANIEGAAYVDLVVQELDYGTDNDFADWADAKFWCGNDATGDAFYANPANLPTANGAVVRTEPSQFWTLFKASNANSTATRIMYKTTDGRGNDIPVTGQVVVPKTAWTGPGPRPLVAFAVGTQGVGDSCAPSKLTPKGLEYETIFMAGLLNRGYALVATDYEGLGTAGMHTYMNRETQGHAVLDSLRAAVTVAGLPANTPMAITGYSQGGGASAAAAELAPTYAPELKLVGAVAGGTPGDLRIVANNLDRTIYVGFLAYATLGLSAEYDMDLDALLNSRGKAFMDDVSTECVPETLFTHAWANTANFTLDGRSLPQTIDDPQWASIVEEQKIGVGRAPAVPTLLTHSRYDDVIPFEAGRGVGLRWCDQGAQVAFKSSVAPGHVGGAMTSATAAASFLEDRFAGKPFTSGCGTF